MEQERSNMEQERKEFNVRVVISGILIGIVFLALTLYLDAVTGLDMCISPVASLISILIIRSLTKKEATMIQTIASALGYSAFALTSNYMAMMLLGYEFNFIGCLIPILLGNIIGICFVSLFQNQYIHDESLGFPQSVMTLTALERAGNVGGKDAALLYIGVAVSGVISLLQNFGIIPTTLSFTSILPENMTFGILLMPIMIGMGYILGTKVSLFMLITTLIVNLIEAPIGAANGWFSDPSADYTGLQTFNLPIVIGVSIAASLIPIARNHFTSSRKKAKQENTAQAGAAQTDTKRANAAAGRSTLPVKPLLAILIAASAALILFCSFYYGVSIFLMVLAVILALFFAMLAVRVQSESGLSAAMALNMCLIIIFFQLTKDPLISLLIPFVSFQITLLAQDTMADLKTGNMVGSSPVKQLWSQWIGAVAGSVAGVLIFAAFVFAYGTESTLFSYPIAHIYASLAEGFASGTTQVFSLGRFLLGAGLGTVFSFAGFPGGAIALSLYLAPTTIMGVVVGGIIRLILTRAKGKEFAGRMDHAATGLIIGDGIVCVLTLFIFLLIY